jgi:1,4-alpha-glucan branching enzyme
MAPPRDPNPETTGYLALVLHAHLPFVRHPEHEVFLEENWLFEAITETYLPLLGVLERLTQDEVPFRLTLSITPTLAAMWNDPLLRSRYARRLDGLVDLAAREVDRTRDTPPFDRLARMYYARFVECRRMYHDWYGRDLVAPFRHFQKAGSLEILASAATHAYLPLLGPNPRAVRAQIRIGVDAYRRHFGRPPAGFWLPECGYAPGIDAALASDGIHHTVLEAHGVTYARPRPRFGVFAPVYSPARLALFGRDVESSRQVWSATEGYPGDQNYREFYRDVGYDLDYDYIRPYIHPDGERMHTGIKYYRVTGRDKHKEPYDPILARRKAEEHAEHFVRERARQVARLAPGMDRPPVVVAPYDAELFGHWWYEGPDWLEALFRRLAAGPDGLRPVTLGEYLAAHPINQLVTPAASSWGWKGYHEVWLEGSNDWMYPRLHAAADRMSDLARAFPEPTSLERRALNQAARELLLAQSSDWAFIMKTATAVDYAVGRVRGHLENLGRLEAGLRQGRIDEPWLRELENRDNVFPELDYRVYR